MTVTKVAISYTHDEEGRKITEALVEALLERGIEVVWDGTIKSRLLVKGFRWRRRGPGPAAGRTRERR